MSAPNLYETDETIRQEAYYTWEADGRPNGRHLEHWERALISQPATHETGVASRSTQGRYEGGISAQPPVV